MDHGSITAVVARIPWPNPLTSTVGFSLRSLHLTFHLLPTTPDIPVTLTSDLADSVASIAESFIHDELTPLEERAIRESFHPDLASSAYTYMDEGTNIPGSIDPFLSAEDDEFKVDADPAGVSIFASLIERLLARFEFDALDTKITIVHPGNASFTISIPEIRYDTESTSTSANSRDSGSVDQLLPGETRKVSISGLSVTARNLRRRITLSSFPPTPSTLSTLSPTISSRVPPQHNTPHSPQSISPSSSSSSLDEEAQIRMTQSLASLPPRPLSPASSLASSLYQSAISTTQTAEDCHGDFETRGDGRTPSPCSRHPEETGISEDSITAPLHVSPEGDQTEFQVPDDILLSFGTEPAVIRFTSPPPSLAMHPRTDSPIGTKASGSPPNLYHVPTKPEIEAKFVDKVQLSLDVGTIACALQAWHIQRLLDIMAAWTAHRPNIVTDPKLPSDSSTPNATGSPTSIPGTELHANLRLRSVVVILLSSSKAECIHPTSDANMNSLATGFFARPLLPPKLPYGYVRTLVEGVSLSLTSNTSTDENSRWSETVASQKRKVVGRSMRAIDSLLSIDEVSILAIHASPTIIPTSEHEISASPILITDRHLPSQYPAIHLHPDLSTAKADEKHPHPSLPIFDVTDWTKGTHRRNGLKLSTWRSKLKYKTHRYGSRAAHVRPEPETASADAPSKDMGQNKPAVSHTPAPAVVVSAQKAMSTSSTRMADDVEVKTEPLHIFVDLGMALNSNSVLAFFDEAFSTSASDNIFEERVNADDESGHLSDSQTSEAEDGCTPPATPGITDEKAIAKERLRLERLVLQDMDLDVDYRGRQSNKKPRQERRKVT